MSTLTHFFNLAFVIFFVLASCSKKEAPVATKPILVPNESVLAKTLLYTNWASGSSLMAMTHEDMRKAMISNIDNRSQHQLSELQELSDNDLCWGAMMYKFLLDAEIFTVQELSGRSLDDYRNTIIERNASQTGLPQTNYKDKSSARNLNIAYGWWFLKNSSTKEKIDKLNSLANNNPTFNLKDDKNLGMDVLRIVRADEAYTFLGVYHAMTTSNHFKLYLAGSNDLKSWTNLAELGDRSHQGDIKKWGNGYVVANEQDPVQGSNNMQIRYYASYTSLMANQPSFEKSIPQTFSHLAEGTPDIRTIEGSDPAASHIVIGYHFYDNGIRDQLAFGILKNFSEWRTWKDAVSNFSIQEMGYQGNIGGRSAFTHNGEYLLQEAQITSGDWSSWRLLFGNGAFYTLLQPTTPLGSISFANPGIAQVGANQFVVTSFMPSQGNQNGERGELLYTVQFE